MLTNFIKTLKKSLLVFTLIIVALFSSSSIAPIHVMAQNSPGIPGFVECNPENTSGSQSGNFLVSCLASISRFIFILGIFIAAIKIATFTFLKFLPNANDSPDAWKEMMEYLNGFFWGFILLGAPGAFLSIFNPAATQINFLAGLESFSRGVFSSNSATPSSIETSEVEKVSAALNVISNPNSTSAQRSSAQEVVDNASQSTRQAAEEKNRNNSQNSDSQNNNNNNNSDEGPQDSKDDNPGNNQSRRTGNPDVESNGDLPSWPAGFNTTILEEVGRKDPAVKNNTLEGSPYCQRIQFAALDEIQTNGPTQSFRRVYNLLVCEGDKEKNLSSFVRRNQDSNGDGRADEGWTIIEGAKVNDKIDFRENGDFYCVNLSSCTDLIN